MDEEWRIIEAFPMYQVSDLGRVMNHDTGRIIRPSITANNIVKIGLIGGDTQQTRSLSKLVAETFVDGRSDIFNTPVQMDGDSRNCKAVNLVWRPRWFAWKYTRQFKELEPSYTRGPVIEIDSGDIYRDLVEASIRNGILIKDVWRSIWAQEPTFPTWQTFAFAK